MVAQIAPRFNNGVPDDAKDALWFFIAQEPNSNS